MRTLAATGYSPDSKRFAYDAPWDADKVYGCVCDAPYASFNCAQRDCPNGDDPLTAGQVNEVQVFKCMASGGVFSLSLEGRSSADILAPDKEAAVKAALEAAPGVGAVTVKFSVVGGTVCQTATTNVVSVEFTSRFGPAPPLLANAAGLAGAITVSADGSTALRDNQNRAYVSIKGTKEADACSNRGICDVFTATCTCMNTNNDFYLSSDGYGREGTRGDCGHAATTVRTCPGEVECANQGLCNAATHRCACQQHWTGADCSLRVCPAGRSWFSYPSAVDRGHDELVPCSGAGACDATTGLCACGDQYYGAACEYLACPGGMADKCKGHGACVSQAQLALRADRNGDATDLVYGTDANSADTWDRDRVFGCDCDAGWAGYDCSLRTCPRGDDPGTRGQRNEVQLLECLADSGSFRLAFRQRTTAPLAHAATAAQVEAALDALPTLTDVAVSFSSGASACVASGGNANTITVAFLTEHADVPSLVAVVSSLVDSTFGAAAGSGTVSVFADGALGASGARSVRGTTEDEECSNRGLCDRLTGVCACFPGYASSNGLGEQGNQGDCGYSQA